MCACVHAYCSILWDTYGTTCTVMFPCIALQGTELLERISKKKELGCKCVSFMTVEEVKAERKASVFWELLGGKVKVKCKFEEVFLSLMQCMHHLCASSYSDSISCTVVCCSGYLIREWDGMAFISSTVRMCMNTAAVLDSWAMLAYVQ